MNKKINLIFDFDGTLVDSFHTAVQKINILAEKFHFQKITPHDISELKHLTSHEVIKYLKIPIYTLPRILHYARQCMRHEILTLSIFMDLPEVLTKLHHAGCSLSIVTSNSSENVTLCLENHQIRHLFHLIHAESSYFGKKYVLKKIIKTHHMDSLQTFYIGDETRDVEAAKKCHIHSIAVLWGFNSEETLTRHEPSYIARTPTDLLNIILNQN